jgi:hypothetical protein
MLETFNRDEFLRLLILKSTTFDQRVLMGQAALALGCQKPAHTGEYLVLDAVAMLLVSMLNWLGVELKPAADAVREHWEGWLELVTRAERAPLPDNAELFFCVAGVLSLDSGLVSDRVEMGEHHEIAAAFAGESTYRPAFVSIHRVLHQLRINAQHANVALPDRLTIAPNEPGYENWRAEIRMYQARAAARLKAKAKAKPKTKAKGRKPIRPPAHVRVVKEDADA